MLARDANETVRAELAAKVATLTAPEGRSAQEKAQRFVEQTLELLARDQATRVRQILAEALKSVAGAPPAVIRQLARDAEDVVACPVLEFSPLLSDEDLLEIIASSGLSSRLCAIARRSSLGETISRSEEHTSELQSLMRISFAVFCLKKKNGRKLQKGKK